MAAEVAAPRAMERARRWAAALVGVAVLGYAAYAVARGLDQTAAALGGFAWGLYAPVLGLTLVNYGLRFLKWHYLLGRLGVRVPLARDAWVFATGLAMVISPGKAGELVKPWLVREMTGAPMARSIPALVTERATDGIAVVALAAVGTTSYYAEGTWVIVGTIAAFAAGIGVLAWERLSLGLVGLVRRLPVVGRLGDKAEEMYRAMRACVAPIPLVVTVAISLGAWFAECVGYWLVWRGLGVGASLDVATFLYASATVFGGPSPGGMGISDGALVEGALRLIQGAEPGQAVAAALLVRLATLWFGVAIGAVAMMRVQRVVAAHRDELTTDRRSPPP